MASASNSELPLVLQPSSFEVSQASSFPTQSDTTQSYISGDAPAVPVVVIPPTSFALQTDDNTLETVLEQRNHLAEGLSNLAGTTGIGTDPESLRVDFPARSSKVRTKKARKPPPVYQEQDRFVPINNISKLMRAAVTNNGKVSKEAKQCMQECVSEYISFLTSEAADRCIDEKRKTLTGDDILFALSTLGFDNYVEPLQEYLKHYRENFKLNQSNVHLIFDEVSINREIESIYMLTKPHPLKETYPKRTICHYDYKMDKEYFNLFTILSQYH